MFETTRTLDDLTLDNVLYHVYLRFFERDRFLGHAERVERMRAIMSPYEVPQISGSDRTSRAQSRRDPA